MPDRAHILGSTNLSGVKPIQTVSILALPKIDPADFPDLPPDMEMRLLTPANGADPSIVLFHPGSEMHLEVPLLEMDSLAKYVARVREAVEQFAMGVVPDGA